jgi:nicotinate-nucleotide--dimethylbenzimidazole phosphoribosyltransferase
VDDAALARKIQIIERALAVNGLTAPDPATDPTFVTGVAASPNPTLDPLDVLARVGGLEIAGMAGVVLAAAARRIPVVLDGFISGAAELVAVALCPAAASYLFAGHVSAERGHRIILEHLGLEPLLNLGMRLGEGTGAALAMGLIDAATRAHREMATFAEAGVSEA